MNAIAASIIVSESKPVPHQDGKVSIEKILIQIQSDSFPIPGKPVWITALVSSEEPAPPLGLRFVITRPRGSSLKPWSKELSVAGGWYFLNTTLHPGHMHFDEPGTYKFALYIKHEGKKEWPRGPAGFCLIDAVRSPKSINTAAKSA